MILFAKNNTPRLAWVADWLGRYLFSKPLVIITDTKEITPKDFVLNYSRELIHAPAFQIYPQGLLFENGITPQEIVVKNKDGLPFFFETGGDIYFDILAASFYLVQRYEEYLPHEKDLYNRYAHENSLAFKHHFLHLPLVDIWLNLLKEKIVQRFPEMSPRFATHQFKFVPTYDVDIAYSYCGKGFWRNWGGFVKSLNKPRAIHERWQVLQGTSQDPFDIFSELDALHRQYKLEPFYFFLLALHQKGLDRNINPSYPGYTNLVRDIARRYSTGIHLSAAASGNTNAMYFEKQLLGTLKKTPVTANRMHYIKFQLPGTYEILNSSDMRITAEYSMGYGSINGFRASTSFPYYWYDLARESGTDLEILPFCYMEANSIFEQKESPAEALDSLKSFHDIIRKAGGVMVTIFHNHLIGTGDEGRRWMNMYKDFLKYQAGKSPA